ncbi:MAG: hypothetical protein A2504_08975 [Bdellovibrionales bacterium RIFOXYD12_FULL_39_22]|nr:MAG: hypothetical protein A2385_13490 [Bdellovibrionales bacterium RIFOXYB1_FULL_39_21]OFZ40897.1 MAG: hypothetical protein A2485_16255 [Bdellovibrionales bacterium RIFOXYC12_FULL_39_17]OFZ44759.1 MAG: hypothetical protein A2404_10865 [Bdellovibrionales bacterium RIFOXYC1_FULL_39_130]OFZ74210.1 MAG: hypothetical protein A2560_03530 [Bdellovibrionales bacterium RIFOXYD1_FULL_39_84]OFZ92090.1 MAG: hypothetical protein A2504_08975 [Bdellovibrionales bacterium RIFOXYD12_FULL_39_22]HLE10590.1 hy
MNRIYLLFALVVVALSFDGSSSTSTSKMLPSFLPENDWHIGVHDKKASRTMTEQIFNDVITRINNIYTPVVERRGNILKINSSWSDDTVNAYAQQTGNTWQINLFGGLARHQAITPDGFAMVVCHEMGHHIGGAPKKTSWFGTIWASSEGQADYYSSAKCVKRYFAEDNNVDIVAAMNVDPIATQKCNQAFSNPEEIAMCQRAAMAGLALGKLFEDLLNETTPIKFSTPDQTVVSRTNTGGYPPTQCRFDTYFAGALCDKDVTVDPSDDSDDENEGFCAAKDNYTLGTRPLCWFKPARN